MAKEFSLFAVVHSGKNWPLVRERLLLVAKPGQKLAYEITPSALRELMPYVSLIERAKKGGRLSPKETRKLKAFFAASKKEPSLDFSAKLVYHAKQRGIEVVPIGSRTAEHALKAAEANLSSLRKAGAPAKEIEAARWKMELMVAGPKERSSFRKIVEKSSPDIVVVGAKHKGAFVGLPHRVAMDDMPAARAAIGKKLDRSMHYRGLARSALAQRRINRLLDKRGVPNSKRRISGIRRK